MMTLTTRKKKRTRTVEEQKLAKNLEIGTYTVHLALTYALGGHLSVVFATIGSSLPCP